ncbi:MAG TPA: YihY/virulence factor BrkB family protein [Gemmatimonadaceae bacterium]|jgi:membrane protein|nr:YihY/virulence factor BrkB family protein [Gemmatimonadaceae bacterium]
MIIHGYRVETIVGNTRRDLWAHGVLGLGAQTAYYFFFSLFPILLFTAPLLAVVGDRQHTMQLILGALAPAVPREALTLVEGVLHDVVFVKGAPGVISVGALLALWTGSNVFSSLTDALNRAFGVPETRPWWKVTLLAMSFVIGAGIAMLVATTLFVFGKPILHTIANTVGLGDTTVALWSIAQPVIAIGLVVAVGMAVFHVLPNVHLTWKEALLGSVTATALWMIVTVAFRLYTEHFSTYNKTYGTIGAVIVLLTWMYLSMLSVLVGGEVASEVHDGAGKIAA